MITCQYQSIGNELCKCSVCGALAKAEDCNKVFGPCSGSNEDPNLYCVFRPWSGGSCICVRGGCERIIKLPEGVRCEDLPQILCKGNGPGLLQRAKNFSKAAGKHIQAGGPKRTQEEINQIVIICKSNECGFYSKKRRICTHRDCGCNVKRKAMWKMEKCPEGFWE